MSELGNVIVSATVIVISADNKALIVQRVSDGAYPNLWTVAGGKVQEKDGSSSIKGLHYDALESCARRELWEETGIRVGVERLNYLTSISTTWDDETKRIIVSFYVWLGQDAEDVDIDLDLKECQAYNWITEAEIPEYGFIPDIGGEIKYAFKIRQAEIERIMRE